MSGGIAWLCARCGRAVRAATRELYQSACECSPNTPDPDPPPPNRRERRIMASARQTGPNWRPRPGVS